MTETPFQRYLREEHPAYLARARREHETSKRTREARCGWGGTPRCTVPLPRRGLCDEHRAALRALTGTPADKAEKAKASGPTVPKVKPRTIDPRDVLDAGDRERVPADERAAHASRWLHRVGEAVTRADFMRVAGVDPLNGASRGVLAVAVSREWAKRGPHGCVMPGDTSPPPRS